MLLNFVFIELFCLGFRLILFIKTEIDYLSRGRTTGFEPANKGVTIQRLTTWPRPPFFLKKKFVILLHQIISTYFAKNQPLNTEWLLGPS